MRPRDWNRIVAGLSLAPIAIFGHAETYLTETQAAAVLWPGITLEPRWMDLDPADIKRIQNASGTKPLSPHVRVFWGPNREALFVDRVLGKHDYITYAAAINADGTVKGIEIMDYRETYGYQVREAGWRDHFSGKSSKDPLKLGQDIPNISGATLSSKHVTDGMRRILQTYNILKSRI
jgi:hypothetical protein